MRKHLFFITVINREGGRVKPRYKKVRTTFDLFCGLPENRPKDDRKPSRTAENRPKDD